MSSYSKFRKWSLIIAETIDAWRIIPRMLLFLYGLLVVNLYEWYKSIPTHLQTLCDPATLQIFISNGMNINQAKDYACHVVNVVGGPTTTQSVMVTTIIGLSTAIFGLYTATGKQWANVDFLKTVPIFKKKDNNIDSSDPDSTSDNTSTESTKVPNITHHDTE